MKIQRSSPARAMRTGNAKGQRADGERFRSLLRDELAEDTEATARANEEQRREAGADATLARAVQVLDEILERIEHGGSPGERTLDEQALASLQALRSELASHAPEPLRRDADAMLAVESERLKRPW